MRRGRILIVDDEPDLVRGLAIRLGAAGHETLAAADAVGALETILARRPDLVILDLQLPGVDGLVLLRRLRELAGAPPVVVLTARTGAEDRRLALAGGAAAFLTKPYAGADLLAAVAAALELRPCRGSARG